MKTAVSIPNEVFERAERLAKRTRKPRSQIYSDALREYLARHSGDEITEAMDKACADAGAVPDTFVANAARRALTRSEW